MDGNFEQSTPWSDTLQSLTRKMLEQHDVLPLLANDQMGLAMKNVDGRFGYIDATDIANERWHIRPYDENAGWEETFENIDELLKMGWAVD